MSRPSQLRAPVDEPRRYDAPSAATVRPWRSGVRSPMVMGVVVLALLAGASAAAAGGWLRIFRTEQVAPVAFSQEDLVALPDLASYGEVEVVDEIRFREVATAEAAEAASGLDAPRLDALPTGVTGEPAFAVAEEVTGTFTFSAEESRQTVEARGATLPSPPAGLDGSTFRLEAGPGLSALWAEERGVPALVVARAVAPTAYSSGVPFDTARDYLLRLPGMPEDVAARLRGLSADGTTLPLPVPADLVRSEATVVDGIPATLLEARDQTMAAVIWVEGGVVTAVAGSVSDDEVLAVARGLR